MKYIHHTDTGIVDYIAAKNLTVSKCPNDASSPATSAAASDVADMLKKSDLLWGTAMPAYLLVSSSTETTQLPLDEAVSQIENAKASDRFVIIAYQDGGLISVTGTKLPFQENADKADWWYPKY